MNQEIDCITTSEPLKNFLDRLYVIRFIESNSSNWYRYIRAVEECLIEAANLDTFQATIAYDVLACELLSQAGNPMTCLNNPAAYMLRGIRRNGPLDAREAFVYGR